MMSVSNPTAHWGSRSSRLFSVILVCLMFILLTMNGVAKADEPNGNIAGGPSASGWYWTTTAISVGGFNVTKGDNSNGQESATVVRVHPSVPGGNYSASRTYCASAGPSPTGADVGAFTGDTSASSFQFGIGNPCPSTTPTGTMVFQIGYESTPNNGTTFVVGAEQRYRYGGTPAPAIPPAPLCTASQMTDTAVSLSGTSLTARAKVTNAAFNKVGIIVPDSGSSTTTPTFNLTANNAVDGSPKYYFGTFTQSTVVTTARLVLYSTTTDIVCYVSLTVGGNTLNSSGSDLGASNPDDSSGASCGLNPFCYIKAALKWAFVPSAGTFNQWQALKDNASTKPPFSIIAGCISYAQGFMNIQTDSDSVELDGGGPHIPIGGGQYGGSGGPTITFAPMVWARDYAASSGWYNDAKTIASIFLYVCFAWWAFGYIQQNFGSKGETQ